MTGGIEVDTPAVRARLRRRLAGTDRQHRALALVEIRNVEVEVQLLRHTVGPLGRPMVRVLLERKVRSAVRLQQHPVFGLGLRFDHAADDLRVELGERERIGAVEGDEAESGDRHTTTVPRRTVAVAQRLSATTRNSGDSTVGGAEPYAPGSTLEMLLTTRPCAPSSNRNSRGV